MNNEQLKTNNEKWIEKTYQAGDIDIRINKRHSEQDLTLTFDIQTDKRCQLHWGLRHHRDPSWHLPPAAVWPPQTVAYDRHAAQTPLLPSAPGRATLALRFDRPLNWSALAFVLYVPEERRWIKRGQHDFCIDLAAEGEAVSPRQALEAWITGTDWRWQTFELGTGDSLAAATLNTEAGTEVVMVTDVEAPLWLHWGLAENAGGGWQMPPDSIWPPGSRGFQNTALQTPFVDRDGLRWLEIALAQPAGMSTLRFVLYAPSQPGWIKADGGDMALRLQPVSEPASAVPRRTHASVAERIISAETGRKSWTLMHRFNLCYEVLEGVEQDARALWIIYTWLRYSAIRQLDWQRRYNTQPRELARAQDRLTARLASFYQAHPEIRPVIRLMLTTLGPGGEGQRVRDEILNIMHRHHIKEAHGTFMEEWHQKLHNNTTPDDVVICEAYLAFLQADGALDVFYRTLEQGGVTRQRLASFDRPITTEPCFYPGKQQGLMDDFQGFLRLLRSVHSGTDLESAITAAGPALDGRMQKLLARVSKGAADAQALPRWAKLVTALRQRLAGQIGDTEAPQALRDLLYLDLALEQALRVGIERQALRHLDQEFLIALAATTLHNLSLSLAEPECAAVACQLDGLASAPTRDVDWALQVKSATDRAARTVGDWSEALYGHLQPQAEFLGEALGVAKWTVPLFSEEVIRGSLPFVLSALLRRLDPLLRTQCGMGGWQIISPANAVGRVCVVNSLLSAQGQRYREPTVLVTDRVGGDEEIPEGVTSVITTDTPDLVSHVAVRARNAHVLFATCFEASTYEQLKAFEHRRLSLAVSSAGDVIFEDAEQAVPDAGVRPLGPTITVRRRDFDAWAIGSAEFNDERVGGKSNHLLDLKGRLSSWIRFPRSIAVPFGVFEQILQGAENGLLAERYQQLVATVASDPEQILPQLRAATLELQAPAGFQEALLDVWKHAGLPTRDWASIWRGLCRVWGSKWNNRAYYSRVALGIAHDELMLAVLIQQVVPADYAFVIHTVNPLTGRRDELFAEVVVGMGETLVGNYPGRAMGFLCRKDDLELALISYPSKSLALDGQGIIFRSDSNGEDLEGFAGAGLYDSFLAEAASKRLVNYAQEPLVSDPVFRRNLLTQIARLGLEVEQALGAPQDIEGAVQQGAVYLLQTRPQVGL